MGEEKPAGLQVVVLVGGTQLSKDRPPPGDALLPTSLVLGAVLPSLWL